MFVSCFFAMPRVLLFGTFDQIHPGHRFVLAEAQKRGEVTVVIARDETVRRLKGRKPVQSEEERRRSVATVISAATVILGDPDDFLKPVRDTEPGLILLGYDQKLPPGVTMEDFPCSVERLHAFQPEQHKSSRLRSDRIS